MSSMNSALRCEYTKIDGTPCGSPALPTSRFCFFHDRFREQHITLNQKPSGPAAMVLPVFEDAASIQIALWEVTRLLLTDQIDHKKAGLVLYALQTASSNLARMAKLAKDAPPEEDWSDVSPDSLWTVLGIDKEEVLRVDRESKAAEAERQRRQFKMNENASPQAEVARKTEGQPVGDIKAVAYESSAGGPSGAAASSATQFLCCHPERSEGSAVSRATFRRMLRRSARLFGSSLLKKDLAPCPRR